ncbi:MAG: DUF1987 domain-containing protein [Bacteroidales bacterium]|nr:DUF1987 domain-containing protein [Bacteroidales bacterium]
MQPLIIEPTQKSPLIELKYGELNFSGCSVHNDPRTFFTPVLNWIVEYLEDPPEETLVNIKFEYIDSSSLKFIFETLRLLEHASGDKRIKVNWHYEQNDADILELGEIIQSKINIDFNFIEDKLVN